MKKWYLIVDVEKCENCHNCFLACKDEHVGNEWPSCAAPQSDHGKGWITIQGKERGQFPLIDVAYLPTPCMHCDDAACIKAAEARAVYKRPDGIVIIDPVKAAGQRQLVDVCPHDAITWNEERQLPQKCTLCAHLLDEGWTKTRCTQSCPTGALTLRMIEEGEMGQVIRAEGLERYNPEREGDPQVLYKNLYRFTRCFVGGSVAIAADGREECAEGVAVSLIDLEGRKVGECVTDAFGDFKIDDIEEGSGTYTVRIEQKGYPAKTLTVELGKSVNVGVVHLEKDDKDRDG